MNIVFFGGTKMNRALTKIIITGIFVLISGCDYLFGVKHDEQSCSTGDMKACFNAGIAYFIGYTVDIDYAKATVLLEKAASSGHVKAQANYASAFEGGLGVPHDTYAAYMWYKAAALKGNKMGLQKIEELKSQLSSRELQAADAEASQMR